MWIVLFIIVSCVWIFSGLFYIGGGRSDIQLSDHYDGEKFLNPGREEVRKSFLGFLKWRLKRDRKEWPEWVDKKADIETDLSAAQDREIKITFINHASFLIQISGFNLITDPIFSERTTPVAGVGPKRVRAPGVKLEELPPIDAILISHNHYDHMDVESIRAISEKSNVKIFCGIGNLKYLEPFLSSSASIHELDWWDKINLSEKIFLHFVPAQHWSKRTFFQTRDALWGGFVVEENSRRIYFAGDTGYGAHFSETSKRLGAMEIALLPIGAYEPRALMKEYHMNPEDAVRAHLDLGSKLSIGMHWGTFHLTNEGIDEPLADLETAKRELGVSQEGFITLNFGETKKL